MAIEVHRIRDLVVIVTKNHILTEAILDRSMAQASLEALRAYNSGNDDVRPPSLDDLIPTFVDQLRIKLRESCEEILRENEVSSTTN